MIAAFTWSNGIVLAFFGGFTGPSAWITCQPNWVCTGFEISLTFSENATFSKGATVFSGQVTVFSLHTVKRPPVVLLESVEYFRASFEKSPPVFSFL